MAIVVHNPKSPTAQMISGYLEAFGPIARRAGMEIVEHTPEEADEWTVVQPAAEPSPDSKRKCLIELLDKRGTSMRIGLFLSPLMIADYVRELAGVWRGQFGGEICAVLVDGTLHAIEDFEKQIGDAAAHCREISGEISGTFAPE